MLGVRRPSSFIPWPIALGSGSLHENPGLWQLAHEMKFEPDSRGSKNRTRPSSARASVYSFPSGYGTEAGRAYFANGSRSPARSLAPPMAARSVSADAEASEATNHRLTL